MWPRPSRRTSRPSRRSARWWPARATGPAPAGTAAVEELETALARIAPREKAP
ncbi:MAG: hypothetical protein WDO13_03550 [Verrucomicrobiota bacterium]